MPCSRSTQRLSCRAAIAWTGAASTSEYTASRHQLSIIIPLTVFLIFLLLFALYSNFKFPFITVLGVMLSAPVGGILRAVGQRHAILGLIGHRLSGAVRRLGADGRGLHFLCQ